MSRMISSAIQLLSGRLLPCRPVAAGYALIAPTSDNWVKRSPATTAHRQYPAFADVRGGDLL